MRRALAGAGIVAIYLAVAAVTFRVADLPVRPLYDGPHLDGFPYRWVDPPPGEEVFNQPPESGSAEIELTPEGSRDADLRTFDLQAGAVFPPQAFDAHPDERRIDLEVSPLDPAEVGPPPSGAEYQGNAYLFEARYRRSGEEAPAAADACDVNIQPYRCISVILRTPFGASSIHRWTGSGWEEVPDDVETGNDIFVDTTDLGIFVATAEPGRIQRAIAAREGVPTSGLPLRDIIAISLGAIATVGASLIYRVRIGAKRREEVRRRAAGKKYRASDGTGRGQVTRNR